MGSDRLAASLFLLLITAQSSSAQPSNNNSSSNNGPYLANANFNPSMAIVVVVLISAFFFLGFFSIYIRQCAGDRLDPRSVHASASAAGRSRRSRGLDPDVLASFPTLLYSDVRHLKIGERTLECAVCLSEFDDSDSLRLLPKCSHAFHPDCIDAWLAAHITCPVCRSNLVPDPNDPQIQDPCCPPDPEPAPAPQVQEPDHVAVEIDDDEHDEREAEMENLERFVNTKRAKSRARPANLPRSHSTGHSLVQPGENLDRFTLRLPEDVRREIVSSFKLQRAKSMVAFPTEDSSRRGFRGEGSTGRAGVRLGRSDRWGSFLMRTLSVKNWGKRDGEGGFFRRGEAGSGSMKGDGGSMKGIRLNAVIAPFDCYGGGASGTVKGKNSLDAEEDESSTSALNRV